MTQATIGQRIKFLIDSQNISVRKFAQALDVAETNVRNYLDKGTKPSSEALEKIVRAFPRTNLVWLVTGEGEPFLTDSPSAAIDQKNNSGNMVGINHGTTTQQQGRTTGHTANLELQLQAANEKIALLASQVADKERMIQLLLNQKP